MSTSIIHQSLVNVNYGPYKLSRDRLDYEHHSYYNKNRQEFQDKIIKKYLESGKTVTNPCIIFTAGVMGAGKGYVIKHLEKEFPHLKNFIHLDPDKIKYLLPEMSEYIRTRPEEAGTLTHQESGYIQEIILWESLRLNKNVILDGSMRHCEWHKHIINVIRKNYINYYIRLIHVITEKEIILKRVEKRFKITGRFIPKEILIDAIEKVPLSVDKIRPLVDYFEVYSNNILPILIKTNSNI